MKKAIYIPAYSDGLMGMFYGKSDKEIAEANQPDFDKKKSLRIYNKDFDVLQLTQLGTSSLSTGSSRCVASSAFPPFTHPLSLSKQIGVRQKVEKKGVKETSKQNKQANKQSK